MTKAIFHQHMLDKITHECNRILIRDDNNDYVLTHLIYDVYKKYEAVAIGMMVRHP